MHYILHIDTATETAHVSLAADGNLLQLLVNDNQKDHAAFVQTGITQLLQQASVSMNDISAVAVTAGPGSYTGLRVGMASAKGLCYALNKPLVAINTLEVMTKAVQLQTTQDDILFCPMIDARRMEVFTAIYNSKLNVVMEPCALILDENSYASHLQKNKILFFGSGAAKWQAITVHPHISFAAVTCLPEAFAALSYYYYSNNVVADLAYIQPYYIKEFKTNI